MNDILCNISALSFLRMPPQIFPHVGNDPDISTPGGRRALAQCDAFLDYIPKPLHLLVGHMNDVHRVSDIKFHVRQHLHAVGSVATTDVGAYLSVTDPLDTLLSLASTLSVPELCMVMYEFCGTFSVVRLRPEHRALLQSEIDRRLLPHFDGWQPMLSAAGKLTDLWRRPPLVTIEQLENFVASAKGQQGCRKLSQAASLVYGVAASPFEVQASLVLCAPRLWGGEGFGPVTLNQRIEVTREAWHIVRKDHLYADLCFDVPQHEKPLIIECQGNAYHSGIGSALSDSDRSAALQTMGYTVLPITQRSIRSTRAYEALRKHIARELHVRLKPKSDRQRAREEELRAAIFSDWWMLGR